MFGINGVGRLLFTHLNRQPKRVIPNSLIDLLKACMAQHPRAVIVTGTDYKNYRMLDRLIHFPTFKTEAEATAFVATQSYPPEVKSVGFVEEETLLAMSRALSREEIDDLLKSSSQDPLAVVLRHRLWQGR